MGVCTDTASYISDAEIKGILKNPSRVNHNYVDGPSSSNILVYDDTEWVSWMSPAVMASRTAIYKSLNMGGTTNWAIDLEDFVDYHLAMQGAGQVLSSRQSRAMILGTMSRWSMMDADTAWNDANEVWKTYDKKKKTVDFTKSLMDTFHGPKNVHCGTFGRTNNCEHILLCQDTVGSGTGPAGAEIGNSLILIHEAYAEFYDAINTAGGTVITAVLSPTTNNAVVLVLSKMPYFLQNAEKAANLKDTTMAMIAGSTSIAKNFLDGNKPLDDNLRSDWTEDKQDLFAAYMSQTVLLWSKSVEMAAQKLFNGEDDSIAALTSIISDGKLIPGSTGDVPSVKEIASELASDMTAKMAKAFYAYAIPAIWDAAGAYPFVIDSGYACGTIDPLSAYMTVDTMRATWACYEDRLYYLASLKGDAYKNVQNPTGPGTHRERNKFSAPAGVTSMGGALYGGVTLTELITGSTAEDLVKEDVTTPGFVRLPVCSPETAFKAWDGPEGDARTKTPNYPCAALLLPNRCGDSTFENQTSGASPKVSDCETIVKNLQNGDGKASHEVDNAIGKQHQLDQFGSCRFGVQGKGKHGNIDFHVGGQDSIDLINDSIKKFARDGRVKGQSVEWGLY
ncbi:hypothetical protein NLG97_g7237 [Lecanicillium saksenae]|uniref:Uncharacterized protein n=1 Tax=Lecanicillium saksenae TaxID=468837 RepID=A0ACC1QMD5_9HYPO|nr:hypothetical protein NLG97_g7237 [Lecanicillium saksenae]